MKSFIKIIIFIILITTALDTNNWVITKEGLCILDLNYGYFGYAGGVIPIIIPWNELKPFTVEELDNYLK